MASFSKPKEGETIPQADVKAMQKRIAALEMENEILKKLQPYSPKRRNNVHGFAFELKYLLQSFKTQNTKTQISNEQLNSKILQVYYESKRRYGASKIFKFLRNASQTAGLKRSRR